MLHHCPHAVWIWWMVRERIPDRDYSDPGIFIHYKIIKKEQAASYYHGRSDRRSWYPRSPDLPVCTRRRSSAPPGWKPFSMQSRCRPEWHPLSAQTSKAGSHHGLCRWQESRPESAPCQRGEELLARVTSYHGRRYKNGCGKRRRRDVLLLLAFWHICPGHHREMSAVMQQWQCRPPQW